MTARPIAFLLASTQHGSLIVNRFDHAGSGPDRSFGVGWQLLEKSSFDMNEVMLVRGLLDRRRNNFGDGVVAVDAGANIGVHTVEWARQMHGWGSVLAFEAQEPIFYALAGNIALNNCLNARARWAALGERDGQMQIPRPDYFKPASFGSLELRQHESNEAIGQPISYDAADCVTVPAVALDSLEWDRLDFIKIDVEGMEADVLRGARRCIERFRPMILLEVIKSDRAELRAMLEGWGYELFDAHINWLALHVSDPMCAEVAATGAKRAA
jgi:FkbM family methyltransferase